MKGDDTDKIKADTEALQKPLYELSAELYKQNQALPRVLPVPMPTLVPMQGTKARKPTTT